MSIDKATPRPWESSNAPGDWGLGGCVFIRPTNSRSSGLETPSPEDIASIEYRTPYCLGATTAEKNQYLIAQANAELIVRAVNSYDAMVEALEAVQQCFERTGSWPPSTTYKVRAALKLARGEQ